ncbi:MAG: hypothetical protein KDK34_20585, partial [Leptospiraceae bacterium]|nr:hypothetical protein [Leptospiraceae bacterium]
TDIESERLQQARESFDTMETAYARFRTRETELQNEIRERKQNLLNTEDQDAQEEYYRLVRRELPAVQNQLDYFRARIRTMNIAGVLERQAWLAFQERRFREAQELYRTIIVRGNGDQATRARTNIERINLTLADGLLRPPVFPPDFERQ